MDTDNKAIFTVGMAAKMLDIHPRTLRNYEDKGLIVPTRKGEWRYYTMRDIQWIECLREMIHVHGVSINEAVEVYAVLEHHRLQLRAPQMLFGLFFQHPRAEKDRPGRQDSPDRQPRRYRRLIPSVCHGAADPQPRGTAGDVNPPDLCGRPRSLPVRLPNRLFFAITTSFPICRFSVLPIGRKLRPFPVVDNRSLIFDIII